MGFLLCVFMCHLLTPSPGPICFLCVPRGLWSRVVVAGGMAPLYPMCWGALESDAVVVGRRARGRWSWVVVAGGLAPPYPMC